MAKAFLLSMSPPATDDAADGVLELTTALRRGEEAAYREFHRRFHDRLRRYCLALAGGDEHRASEALQSVFLRVARHVKALPHEAALWQWLVKAARSAIIDQARSRKRYFGLLRRFTEGLGHAEQALDPNGDGLLAALDLALADLDDEGRRLIEAKYFQGDSVADLAGALGVTVKAIEGRLSRVRATLRQRVAHHLQRNSDS